MSFMVLFVDIVKFGEREEEMFDEVKVLSPYIQN